MKFAITIFVDASFDQFDGSFAWAAIYEVEGKKKKIGKGGLYCSNSTVAEAIGIRQAIIEVAGIYPNSKIEVKCDCLSVVSMLLGESFTLNRELGKVISEIKNFENAELSYSWVNGHEKGWETKNKSFNKQADMHANQLRKKRVA